ncbi:hypothetical protein DFJ73DRAFT_841840 [Zopfochytrium polystomum]|nr:hypothetical protein DFJ73DRAFT_841840 [Zopfochytrium polystomum]
MGGGGGGASHLHSSPFSKHTLHKPFLFSPTVAPGAAAAATGGGGGQSTTASTAGTPLPSASSLLAGGGSSSSMFNTPAAPPASVRQPPADFEGGLPPTPIHQDMYSASDASSEGASPTVTPGTANPAPAAGAGAKETSIYGRFLSIFLRSRRGDDPSARVPLLRDDVLTEEDAITTHSAASASSAAGHVDYDDGRPRVYSYLGESIIVSILSLFCLCTLPVGLTAVYYAAKVNQPPSPSSQPRADDEQGMSRSASRRRSEYRASQVHNAFIARTLAIIAGTGSMILWIVVFVLFAQLLRP